MEKKTPFTLTREKHLDHMVKVVPFIVMGYAIQSYVLWKMDSNLGETSIMVLGLSLVALIAGFITYDIRHQVFFEEDHFQIRFLGLSKKILYSDIKSVQLSESKQTFASLRIHSAHGSFNFFFVDDADSLKAFLDSRKDVQTFKQAA